MKKSMESAYTDMMNNLAKSTSAVPVHLQGATGALAWWESSDSLLAKANISGDDTLQKCSAEHETEEAYEEDAEREEGGDPREESNAANDVHGGDGNDEEGDDEEEDDEEEGEMEKSLRTLDSLSTSMLNKSKPVGDSFLPGQVEAFPGMPTPAPKKPKKAKGKESEVKKSLGALNTIADRILGG